LRIFSSVAASLVAGALSISAVAHSQAIPQSLAGLVEDAAGARIPHAHLSLTSLAGAAPILLEANDEGEFHLPVPAAATSLQLSVSAPGFQATTIAISNDSLKNPAAPLEIHLDLSGTTESVEVTAAQLVAETESTQLGESLAAAKIEAVPLNGRSFTDLMAVQPGITPASTSQPGAVIMTGVASTPPSGNANPGNLSISGQRESSNGFRINGSDAEEDVNMGTAILPNLDSIDSFRILTSNFDAEYGNSSGGEVLVNTRQGTDRFHGSAFEFLRNTELDARNYFSTTRAAYRQNQFGGTLGGTLGQHFPLKGLNFFTDYQGTRLTQGIDTGHIAVPTTDQRSGIISPKLLTNKVSGSYLATLLSQRLGRTVTKEDYYSDIFADGQIPTSAWSAPAKHLLSYIPTPNSGSDSFSSATEDERLTDNKGALRLDWQHRNQSFSGYYFQDRYWLDNPYPTGTGGASVPGFDATSRGRAQLAALTHTATFHGSALNQLHISYMRNANTVGQPKGGLGTTLASQGFNNIVVLKSANEGIANVAFNDFTMGVDTTGLTQAENIYELSESWSQIVGHHGLKFGGEIHSSQINTHPDVVFNGSFSFNGSETGLDFADFLLGVPSSYTQGQASSFYNQNLYLAAFAQDSWKPTPHLTLNYGIRWDRIRPWQEKYNQLQTLIEGEQSEVFPGAPKGLVFPGDKGVPRSLAPAQNNFSPRFGLAWSPDFQTGLFHRLFGSQGQTSIRSGYGLFYTAYEGLSAGIMSANPPYGYTYTSAAPPLFENPFTVASTGVDAGQRFPLQHVAYGASRSNPNTTVDWSQFEPLVGIPAVSPSDVTPYAEHWMLSLERQIAQATLLTVTYTGAGAHHLLALEEANPANPTLCLSLGSACGPFNEQAARTRFSQEFGSVVLQKSIANSSYHALELTLNRRIKNADILASYTWSKSIDQSAGLPEPINPVNNALSRGLSAFDIRHNFVASFHYPVPTFRLSQPVLKAIAADWAFSGILRFTTGLPVTLVNNNDTSLLGTIPNGINNNGIDTPQWDGKSIALHTKPRGSSNTVFDADSFSLPTLGTLGNARRRFFSGPGMENLDATLERHIPTPAHGNLEMRLEAFNVFNHGQFFGAASVQGNISSASFGQAVSASAPRLMQVALRWSF